MTALLVAVVPLLMVGYFAYRHFADERDEREAERRRFVGQGEFTPPPPTTPRPWIDRDPPVLEVAAVRPNTDGGLIAYVRPDEAGAVRVVTLDGSFVAGLDGFDKDYRASSVVLSRDRKRLAVLVGDNQRQAAAQDRGTEPQPGTLQGMMGVFGEVLVYDLGRPGPPVARLARDRRQGTLVWGGDLRTLYLSSYEWRAKGFGSQTDVWERYDVDASTGMPIGLPENNIISDVSPDGMKLLVNEFTPAKDGGGQTATYLMDAATLERKRVSETSPCLCRFSPDGTKAVGVKFAAANSDEPGELVIVNLVDGRESAVKMGDDDTETMWPAYWSPDGNRLAVVRLVILPGENRTRPYPRAGNLVFPPKTRYELTLRKLDGSDSKPFTATEGVFPFDWR